jgi:hypothetical protein
MSGADVSATNTTAHTADTPQLLLEHHLKELRLPTILREYDKVARQSYDAARDWDRLHERFTVQPGRCRYHLLLELWPRQSRCRTAHLRGLPGIPVPCKFVRQ